MLEGLLLLAAAAGQGPDPLAEAKAGKVQCITPNRETKTCAGMVSYTVRDDGGYESTGTMMIVPSPLILVEVRSSGKVEGDAVCSVLSKADFANAKITMADAPVNATMDQAIKSQLVASVEALDGTKGCGRDHADGDIMVAEMTVDGVARPELTQRFIWVKPDEGYKIGQ
jgi:hypothetical protein